MNVSLNEVATAINNLSVLIDDSDNEIYAVDLNNDRGKVHLSINMFLSEFIEFEVNCQNKKELSFPFKLKHEIFGVEFFALMNAENIVDLEQSMPEQFEYISKMLQKEGAR